jgi:hypothetical protein
MAANEELERAISCRSLEGKWEVVGSEIPTFGEGVVIKEWYQFSEDQFWLEFLLEDGKKEFVKYNYLISDEMIRFESKKSPVFEIVAFHVAEFLIIRPSHGMEIWMVRIGNFGE